MLEKRLRKVLIVESCRELPYHSVSPTLFVIFINLKLAFQNEQVVVVLDKFPIRAEAKLRKVLEDRRHPELMVCKSRSLGRSRLIQPQVSRSVQSELADSLHETQL